MKKSNVVLVPSAIAALACAAHADPSGLPAQLAQATTGAASADTWLSNYIAAVTGPQVGAGGAGVDGPTDGPPTISRNPGISDLLALTLAGPSNQPGPGLSTAFTISASPSDDPGQTGPGNPLSETIQPVSYPPQTDGPPSSLATSGDVGVQVVVPLPGAGALAAAGLVFVAIRRRRG